MKDTREEWLKLIEGKLLSRIKQMEENALMIRETNMYKRKELERQIAAKLAREFRLDKTDMETFLQSKRR